MPLRTRSRTVKKEASQTPQETTTGAERRTFSLYLALCYSVGKKILTYSINDAYLAVMKQIYTTKRFLTKFEIYCYFLEY